MKKKAETIPLRRVCVNLRDGDYEWLQQFPSESPSERIRNLVIGFRKRIEDQVREKVPANNLKIDYEDIDV